MHGDSLAPRDAVALHQGFNHAFVALGEFRLFHNLVSLFPVACVVSCLLKAGEEVAGLHDRL